MDYVHLIYYSKAMPQLTQDDLSRILTTARRENSKNEITGFLIYRDHHFLQFLEGHEAVVIETLERIKKDDRHSGINIIGRYQSENRFMPKWSMALVDSKKYSDSSDSLIELFDVARGRALFSSQDSLELVLRKFAKDAELFVDSSCR